MPTDPMPTENSDEPMISSTASMSDVIASLESSLSATQPTDRQQEAEALIAWLQNEGAIYVRPDGAIAPSVIASYCPPVEQRLQNLEGIEYLLSIAEEMQLGQFVLDPTTEQRLWQLNDPYVVNYPGDTAATTSYPDSAESTSADSLDELDFAAGRPDWMSNELIEYITLKVSEDPDVSRFRLVSQFYNALKYRKSGEYSRFQVLATLKLLAFMGVVEFTPGNVDSFRFVGFTPSDD